MICRLSRRDFLKKLVVAIFTIPFTSSLLLRYKGDKTVIAKYKEAEFYNKLAG